jgi:WD40 repeat protein
LETLIVFAFSLDVGVVHHNHMLSFLGRGRGGGGGGDAAPSPTPGTSAAAATAPSSAVAAADDDLCRDGAEIEIVCEDTLEGHSGRVWCVAWEPHGRCLATCSSDKTVRLWAPSRAAGGAWVTVAELEGVHNRTVRTVAWSPCGECPHTRKPKTQKHKNTKTQKHKNTKTQKHKNQNTKVQIT